MASARDLGGSKGGKNRSKGVTETIVTEKALETPKENILALRAALFNDDGSDKDVLKDYKAFHSYKKNGLNIGLSFLSASKLTNAMVKVLINMTERNMQEHYINSGVGWDTKVEEEEIQDPSSRFILAHNLDNQDGFNIVGFVHFKFTMQGELFNEMIGDPCVFINTIQVDAAFRRLNLGKHLLQTIEFIAKKNSMNYVMFTIPKTCDEARHFFTDKGYDYDGMVYEEGMMVEDPEDVNVMTKCISARIMAERAKGSEVQDFARMLAEQMAKAKGE